MMMVTGVGTEDGYGRMGWGAVGVGGRVRDSYA